MKSEFRMAGLFASLTFLVIGIGGYLGTLNILQSLIYGLMASIAMGIIGYQIAHIISHPMGRRRKRHKGRGSHSSHTQQKSAPSSPITGEETFLEDLGA